MTDTDKAIDIVLSNYDMAVDQASEYPSLKASLAAYLVNAVDTAEENGISREETARLYLTAVLDSHVTRD